MNGNLKDGSSDDGQDTSKSALYYPANLVQIV